MEDVSPDGGREGLKVGLRGEKESGAESGGGRQLSKLAVGVDGESVKATKAEEHHSQAVTKGGGTKRRTSKKKGVT